MPLDPRAQRFLDMARASGTREARPPIAERRAALAKLMGFWRADRMAGPGQDGTLPGPGGDRPYRLYAPSDAPASGAPGFLFFHGGGLVAGGLDTHEGVCRALAEETGCRLVAVGYRLAPEHPFPAALEDAAAAADWLLAQAAELGIDPSRLVIGGDSAGATLAVATVVRLREAGRAPFALQCLICPVLDSGGPSASREAFAQGYLIDRVTLAADLADYLPDGIDPADPRVSPLRAQSLAGLPPALIHTAEFDPLRDEGEAFAGRLAREGVAVRHTRHAGMVHNFHALGAILPQGRAVLRQIGEEVRAALACGDLTASTGRP